MTTQSSPLSSESSSSGRSESSSSRNKAYKGKKELESKHKEDHSGKLGKRKVKDHEIEDMVPYSKQFQRIWTSKDEVTLLKALGEFQKEANDQFLDKKKFLSFVEGSLREKVREHLTVKSLSSKIDRLRKKYLNLEAKRHGQNVGEHVFSSSHDIKIYNLGKMIWGVTKNEEINVCVDLEDDVDEEKTPLYPFLDKNVSKYPHVIALIPNQIQMSELISSMRAKELDERWKEQQLKEAKIEWERAELVRECTMLLKKELQQRTKP